ncbi:hypothetical protein PILCRDRAFT_10761 [Piloderma croceum F 1598]|uniref:Uncharacterized protein n=1 Tax=Piloderma croceum (strain F 1598) TaxID=765440 RepID=A0A0C3BNB9_PILCF|nr:hypothetical protein PILCRDRAFT_10761 [Piloderma croceum F 1598]
MNLLPRWPNLNHFSNVLNVAFSDGRKFEDILKGIIFASHNVLDDNSTDFLLLKCIRSKAVLSMYIGLKVQTEDTIAEGQEELLRFSLFMEILSNNHHHLTVKYIRQRITDLDEVDIDAEDDHEPNIDTKKCRSRHFCAGHVLLGSYQSEKTFETVEIAHASPPDSAFISFRKRLTTYLNIALPAEGIDLPSSQGIQFQASDVITEYRMLSVDYESTEDWRMTTDLLRCNPCFYKRPRYDCVLIQTISGPIFACLLFLLTCQVNSTTYPVALIQPFDAYAGPWRNKDWELGLHHVRAKARSQAEFISVRSVIRGAYVVPTHEHPEDYFVSDLIDSDWFLRLMQLTK